MYKKIHYINLGISLFIFLLSFVFISKLKPVYGAISCSRCSTTNGCQFTQFVNNTNQCTVPDPGVTVTRTVNCGCGFASGPGANQAICDANCCPAVPPPNNLKAVCWADGRGATYTYGSGGYNGMYNEIWCVTVDGVRQGCSTIGQSLQFPNTNATHTWSATGEVSCGNRSGSTSGGTIRCGAAPTPTPITNLGCNARCTGSSQCASGYCFSGVCRNPANPNSATCAAPTSTPRNTATPTPRATATKTPTPRATATVTPRATATPTKRPTATPTRPPGVTATPTLRATATVTPRATATSTRTGTPTKTPTPTPCVPAATVSLSPSSTSKSAGQAVLFTATLSGLVSCGSPVRVDFSSSDSSIATVSPLSDSTGPYRTTATATSNTSTSGRATIAADVYIGGVRVGSDSSRFDLVAGALPTCTFDLLPTTSTISVGQLQNYTVSNINVQNGGITRVDFSISDPAVAAINPITDSSPTYTTGVTGLSVGANATITADMYMTGSLTPVCSDTATVDVSNISPWWQTKAGDVVTNGGILSEIPASCTAASSCKNSLIDQSPGIAIASGSIDTGTGNVSQAGWESNSQYTGASYNYNYFETKARCGVFNDISSPTISSLANLTSGQQSQGYYWVRYTGGVPLTISNDLDLGNEKILLFVKNTDLLVNGKINLNAGRGFFMTVVSGNIDVNPSVGGPADGAPDLEGIFFTNHQFRTGTKGPGLDEQLHTRGSVVAFDRVVLERNLLTNDATPSELFEYAPEFLMEFPQCLGESNINWRELAP